MCILRDALSCRLEENIHFDSLVAVQQISQKTILTHRSTGKEQNAEGPVDDLDLGFRRVVCFVTILFWCNDAENKGLTARLGWQHLELDRHSLAVGAKRDFSFFD